MSVEHRKNGEVAFIYEPEGGARSVYVAGDFNNWDPGARRMVKVKDGSYRAKLELGPGKHQYKFVVDGEWRPDPTADSQCTNEFGTINSVVAV